jgi:integrase
MPEHARAGAVVLVATGMRLGEYMRTTKDHLRPSTLGIDVPGTKTKASKAMIRVDERLWPWIEAGIPAPLKEGWLRRYWQRAYKKLGFKDLRLHDLRHCHGQ